VVNLYCRYSIMKSQSNNILCYMCPFYRYDTTNIGIELGSHWQMTHVESANEVVHLHNIK
jgi:hypothetical protein